MTTSSTPAAVDWSLAVKRAHAITPPGPKVSALEGRAHVAALRAAARAAPEIVAQVTGLDEAAARAGAGPVYVVDRSRWVQANVQMFAEILGDSLPVSRKPGSARAAGEQLGIMLPLLATRVLGQFDPFTSQPGAGAGRLLVVAPNVLHVQREIGADPGHFGLWVCLHEQTHAVQFAAAPWLPDYLRTAMTSLTQGLADEDAAPGRARDLARALPQLFSDEPATATSGGVLVDAVLSDAERVHLERTLAVMALLEGHADVVMDAAGPGVVPSVESIRAAFEVRRDGRGLLDQVLRRLLGLDAKLAQYRQGAGFVRGVIDKVGHSGLNAVWTEPAMLPVAAEIADPGAWVRRVHG